MIDSKDRHVAYVRQVNAELKGFVEGLTKDNDRLSFELTRTQQELAAMQRRAKSLEEEVTARIAEQEKLQQLVQSITSDNTDLHARLTEVMSQANDITNLYVASHQLHSAITPEKVIEAIHDIVINIVGSEEFVILERRGENGVLSHLKSFGVPKEELASLTAGEQGVLRDALARGMTYMRTANGSGTDGVLAQLGQRDITACVPLKLGRWVSGLVVIFSLLPQKPRLTQGDEELFDLLSRQAAGALHLSRQNQAMT